METFIDAYVDGWTPRLTCKDWTKVKMFKIVKHTSLPKRGQDSKSFYPSDSASIRSSGFSFLIRRLGERGREERKQRGRERGEGEREDRKEREREREREK